jgi:hypothetical protein
MLLPPPVVQEAVVQAQVFAPPLGIPIEIVSERRETGARERSFTLRRLIRFAGEGDGYRAEVMVRDARSEGPAALTNMVEAGFAALAGRTIVVRLDRAGRLVSVEDMTAHWERFCDGIAGIASTRRSATSPEREALARRVSGPLRALPPDRQRDMLGTLVTAIVAEAADPVGEARPVQLPGASPFGRPALLQGTRRTSRTANGGTEAVTQASADVSLPAEGAAPARSGRLTLDVTRRTDPGTGLVTWGSDTLVTTTGTGTDAAVTRRTTTISSRKLPPGSWPAG